MLETHKAGPFDLLYVFDCYLFVAAVEMCLFQSYKLETPAIIKEKC